MAYNTRMRLHPFTMSPQCRAASLLLAVLMLCAGVIDAGHGHDGAAVEPDCYTCQLASADTILAGKAPAAPIFHARDSFKRGESSLRVYSPGAIYHPRAPPLQA